MTFCLHRHLAALFMSCATCIWTPTSVASADTQVEGVNRSQTESLLLEARRLLADSLPEDRSKAENLIIEAIRQSPHSVEAFIALGRFQLSQLTLGHTGPAGLARVYETANHVRDLAPDRPEGHLLLSEVLIAMGKTRQGRDLFEYARRKFPAHSSVLVFEARLLLDSKPLHSIELSEKALSLGASLDEISPIVIQAAISLSTNGKGVGERLSAFGMRHPDRWIWHRAAMAFSREGNFPQAKEAFEKAMAAGNQLESPLQLGILLYQKTGEHESSWKYLQKTRDKLSAHIGIASEKLALVDAHRIMSALKGQNSAWTLEASRDFFKLESLPDGILQAVIDELRSRGFGEQIYPLLRAWMKDNPLLENGHAALAGISAEAGRSDDALAHYDDAIAVAPENASFYTARAHLFYQRGDYDFALAHFNSALRINPDDATLHYNRACMLALLGKNSEALSSLKTAVRMRSDFRRVAASDKDLSALWNDSGVRSELEELGVIEKEGRVALP